MIRLKDINKQNMKNFEKSLKQQSCQLSSIKRNKNYNRKLSIKFNIKIGFRRNS